MGVSHLVRRRIDNYFYFPKVTAALILITSLQPNSNYYCYVTFIVIEYAEVKVLHTKTRLYLLVLFPQVVEEYRLM